MRWSILVYRFGSCCKRINILSPYENQQMLCILQQIRDFLLRAAKRYSLVRLLQCLLSFCRAVFRRCKLNSGKVSRYGFSIAKGKEFLAEESMGTSVPHLISGSQAPPSASIDLMTIQTRPQPSSQYVRD